MKRIPETLGLILGTMGACVLAQPVGQTPDETDSGDPTGVSDDDSETEPTATSRSSDSDGKPGDGPACLDSPQDACPSPDCGFGCGGPFARFDEDGCVRPHCTEGTCPVGRTCVALRDYGTCAASTVGCFVDPEEGCICGGTLDCSPEVTICVPDDELPPPAAQCNTIETQPAFEFEPSLGDGSATATCTVTSLEPLVLDCTGDLEGVYTLILASAAQPALSVGQVVTVNATTEVPSSGEWLNRWLRITTDEFPFQPVVAVYADTLLPSGANADAFWPTNVEIATTTIGCPEIICEEGGSKTGVAILANEGSFPSGSSGQVPGKFGGERVFATIGEARQGGGCEETLISQPAWFNFTLIQQL